MLSDCVLNLRGAEASLAPLFRSLEYGAPRASALCMLGDRHTQMWALLP